jgi:ribonuclease T
MRFRGFLPVVLDVETGGFNKDTDALLELSASLVTLNDDNHLETYKHLDYAIEPFAGCNIEPSAIEFNGIDPYAEDRNAIPEQEALKNFFNEVRHAVKEHDCTRAIVVAHNAHFDHGFVMAAAERCAIKRNPFHPFSCFDTVTLSGLAFGQTVLARACQEAQIGFNNHEAHSASYDARKTAELFCKIVNLWQDNANPIQEWSKF